MIPARLAAFLHLSRPHFLVFSTLPYLLGLLVAWREGAPLDSRMAWGGLVAQLLVQLSTAYINDYYDLPSDRLNRRRTLLSGGSGELAAGLLPPRAALIAAAVGLGGAVGLGLILTAWGMDLLGWAVLGLVALGDGLALLLLGQTGALIGLVGLPVAAAAGLGLRRHLTWNGPRLLLMVVWTALVPALALVILVGAVLGGAV